MTATLTGEPLSTADPALPYTSYRIALASGILGGTGATLGWIFSLAWRMRSWELAGSVVVGAFLGYAVHWFEEYIHAAKRERHAASAPRPGRAWRALVWAAGFAFLGLVTEHLVAHIASEFLFPFVASIATLLPAGMILGWSMNRGRKADDNLLMMIADGVLVGIAITLVTGLIWRVGFGATPWFTLASWWILIGVTARIVTPEARNATSVAEPIKAIVLAFVLILLLNLLPLTDDFYKKFGPLQGMAAMGRTMAAEVQQSPALPATFWLEAETRFAKAKADSIRAASPPAPPVAAPVAPPAPVPGSIVPHGTVSATNLHNAVVELTDTVARGFGGRVANLRTLATSMPFVRSWLVIILFAIGVGLAPWVERSLRPIDYPNSETYRKDIRLTIMVLLGLVVAIMVGRVDQCSLPHKGISPVRRAFMCVRDPHWK